MSDATTVPPVPFKTPVLDATGFLTTPWYTFFRQIFYRVGGTSATSNTQIEIALQVSVATLARSFDDLNQGPTL